MTGNSKASARLPFAIASIGLACILSVIVMAISIGESCGFSPGMLIVAVIFGPMLLGTPYVGGTALLMALVGFVGKKRGVYVNIGIVILGFTAFVALAIARAYGVVPWPSECTVNF